jgi:hypothetical protein
MRLLPLLLLVLGCGPSDSGTTSSADDDTSGGDPGAIQMRDTGPGPTSDGDLGQFETSGSGSAVATTDSDHEARPNIDVSDPDRRETERPLTPTDADRSRIFRRLHPDIRQCLRGMHASFTIRLRVESSGIVREALVEGEHVQGTDKAQCIEGAFRDVMFPAFRDPETTMRHNYRF